MPFGTRLLILLPIASVVGVVFCYFQVKHRPYAADWIWWTYVALLWAALWWMWHPRLSSNPLRYVLNVAGLWFFAGLISAIPWFFVYLFFSAR